MDTIYYFTYFTPPPTQNPGSVTEQDVLVLCNLHQAVNMKFYAV